LGSVSIFSFLTVGLGGTGCHKRNWQGIRGNNMVEMSSRSAELSPNSIEWQRSSSSPGTQCHVPGAQTAVTFSPGSCGPGNRLALASRSNLICAHRLMHEFLIL
jgi:hypothetical protein